MRVMHAPNAAYFSAASRMAAGSMTVLNRTGRVFSTLREAGTGQPVLTFRAAMAAKSLSGAVSIWIRLNLN